MLSQASFFYIADKGVKRRFLLEMTRWIEFARLQRMPLLNQSLFRARRFCQPFQGDSSQGHRGLIVQCFERRFCHLRALLGGDSIAWTFDQLMIICARKALIETQFVGNIRVDF